MGSAHFELLSSTFTAGAYQKQPELRVPSIKGQLRWWTRALLGVGRPEYELFGGIKGTRFRFTEDPVAGSFIFRLVAPNLQTDLRSLCPHDSGKGTRKALIPQASGKFELHWCPRFGACAAAAEMNLERVIRAWLLLGAVGCRSNRAAGSIWPAGYLPTEAEFTAEVASLTLPKEVAVRILGAPRTNPEDLRTIATDMIEGRIPGAVLGFVDGKKRKASALKLKVGRFVDGFRLIAVFDMRTGRGSHTDFTAVATQLNGAGKPVGSALVAALGAKPL